MFECVRSEVHVTTERLKYKGVVSWEGEVELVLECPCSAPNYSDRVTNSFDTFTIFLYTFVLELSGACLSSQGVAPAQFKQNAFFDRPGSLKFDLGLI